MRDVSIIGVGMTPIGEHWGLSLRDLAADAAGIAFDDAQIDHINALYVGNMLAGQLSRQENIGALIADGLGLRGVEALRIEAAEASGAAALRQGYLAVASGAADIVMVLGVEKITDLVGAQRLTALGTGLDANYEGEQGATPAAMAALLMQRYMHEYGVELEQFAGFSVNAHANGARNRLAMFQRPLKAERFASAPPVAPPVSLFDAAPEGDGAAAVILAATEQARDLVPKPVRVVGSAVATDALAVHDRANPLVLQAAADSAARAYEQAGIDPEDVDLFELHDSFTIMSALALEACGFAPQGEGFTLADEAGIGLEGSLPITTFGGLKARGHAVGASGVYQAVEAALQLRGDAGDNQVADARIAMTQNLGGIAATAITHLFQAI